MSTETMRAMQICAWADPFQNMQAAYTPTRGVRDTRSHQGCQPQLPGFGRHQRDIQAQQNGHNRQFAMNG